MAEIKILCRDRGKNDEMDDGARRNWDLKTGGEKKKNIMYHVEFPIFFSIISQGFTVYTPYKEEILPTF